MIAINIIYYSIVISIISVVYVMILQQPGMLLDWWNNILNKMPDWISKPLGTCEYCFSGQVALWGYLFIWNNWIEWVFFTALTIFLTHIISWIYEKTT